MQQPNRGSVPQAGAGIAGCRRAPRAGKAPVRCRSGGQHPWEKAGFCPWTVRGVPWVCRGCPGLALDARVPAPHRMARYPVGTAGDRGPWPGGGRGLELRGIGK